MEMLHVLLSDVVYKMWLTIYSLLKLFLYIDRESGCELQIWPKMKCVNPQEPIRLFWFYFQWVMLHVVSKSNTYCCTYSVFTFRTSVWKYWVNFCSHLFHWQYDFKYLSRGESWFILYLNFLLRIMRKCKPARQTCIYAIAACLPQSIQRWA